MPFPTHRLASSALRALQVDAELSPSVCRTFSLTKPEPSPQVVPPPAATNGVSAASASSTPDGGGDDEETEALTVLQTEYKATTNRMLRVAVNAFMDSLGVVLNVMEELDVDVLSAELGKR